MTEFQAATLAIAAGQLSVGVAGILLVWQGLRQMRRAGDQREKREDARHTEAMQALDSQAEALRAVVVGLERQGAGLEAALKGGRV